MRRLWYEFRCAAWNKGSVWPEISCALADFVVNNWGFHRKMPIRGENKWKVYLHYGTFSCRKLSECRAFDFQMMMIRSRTNCGQVSTKQIETTCAMQFGWMMAWMMPRDHSNSTTLGAQQNKHHDDQSYARTLLLKATAFLWREDARRGTQIVHVD